MNDKRKVYIDIDSLMDTKLQTLINISAKIAIEAMDNGYPDRPIDNFGKLSLNNFLYMYSKRDEELLLSSRPTNILEILLETVTALTSDLISIGINDGVEVVINTSAYIKMSEDTINLIKIGISESLDNIAKVTVMRERLSFNDMAEYECVFMSDGLTWLGEELSINLGTLSPTDTKLVIPTLINDIEYVNDSTYIKKIINGFSDIIEIIPIPTQNFSYSIKKK